MPKRRVLIVDDETDFAAFVTDVAAEAGFDAHYTDDPSQFALFYTIDTEIVILDLFMPEVDGIELLRFLADNRSQASLIFMSGKDLGVLQSASRLAAERGVSVLGTLQKPFRAVELEKLLAGYIPQGRPVQASSGELPTRAELKAAIERNELHVAYQPQIRLADRQAVGVEAFARWTHATKGSIPPSCFIPLAEAGDLIADLTALVARKAVCQMGEWRRRGLDLRMSINISPTTLDHLEMPEELADLAARAAIDTRLIMIEVTETALMSDVARYMDILTRIRMKGFGLSIDDFGTGYSSLQQLVRVPFNELKIDQTFVRRLDADSECRTITEISILLAHKLGMHVMAEGIETEPVWHILRDLGCEAGQGYWMGRPMRPRELEHWLRDWNAAIPASIGLPLAGGVPQGERT